MAKAAPAKDLNALRIALVDACLDSSLDRGLSLDPDAEAETEAEELVEDLAEQLEDRNPCSVPTASPDMDGSWELVYTSSSLTRFHGGLSGLQKYVDGEVGRITQEIDTESGVCTFYEQVMYNLPVVNKPAEVTVTVTGKIRAVNETRQMWTPETINAAWFKLWAESWKSVRAFTVAETTYLDKQLRITRGQTGSLTIYARTQSTN
jgi:PAP_fibrillin